MAPYAMHVRNGGALHATGIIPLLAACAIAPIVIGNDATSATKSPTIRQKVQSNCCFFPRYMIGSAIPNTSNGYRQDAYFSRNLNLFLP